MKRLLTYILLTAGLSACSSMDYMDRNDLAQLRGSDNIDEMKYTGYGTSKAIRTYGAINIDNFNEETGQTEQTVFGLKRYKNRFYAETQLSESDNKEKSFFDETIFNFGVDKKTKALNVELSFKF